MNKVFRTIGLWILIVFTVALNITCFVTNCFPWQWVFLGITLWICGWEIYGSTIGWKQPDGARKRHTISQLFWKFSETHKTAAIIIVTLFALAMLGLEIHLLA